MISKEMFLKKMEKLLVLPNIKMFEELPDMYYELINDFEEKVFDDMLKEILLNEEYFPTLRKWLNYCNDYRRKMMKSYYFHCLNCNRYYSFKLKESDYLRYKNNHTFKCMCGNELKEIITKKE